MTNQNEISRTGTIIAGILLITFLIAPILVIIALWPDKIPDTDNSAIYTIICFHVRLVLAANEEGLSTYTAIMSLNTLLLILVACGGFLGNMIHIASSFISYIGAAQFKRSWTMWYFVKPFTAAGLALAFYFALKAGFFNSPSATVNIYGVMIAAILAGLFTDDATLKLKEVFGTIFKPKDDRPDKLNA